MHRRAGSEEKYDSSCSIMLTFHDQLFIIMKGKRYQNKTGKLKNKFNWSTYGNQVNNVYIERNNKTCKKKKKKKKQ